jgi:hypothetical protein
LRYKLSDIKNEFNVKGEQKKWITQKSNRKQMPQPARIPIKAKHLAQISRKYMLRAQSNTNSKHLSQGNTKSKTT